MSVEEQELWNMEEQKLRRLGDVVFWSVMFCFLGFVIGLGSVHFFGTADKRDVKTYRDHIIRNNVGEWAINADGKVVFVLKGKLGKEDRK